MYWSCFSCCFTRFHEIYRLLMRIFTSLLSACVLFPSVYKIPSPMLIFFKSSIIGPVCWRTSNHSYTKPSCILELLFVPAHTALVITPVASLLHCWSSTQTKMYSLPSPVLLERFTAAPHATEPTICRHAHSRREHPSLPFKWNPEPPPHLHSQLIMSMLMSWRHIKSDPHCGYHQFFKGNPVCFF